MRFYDVEIQFQTKIVNGWDTAPNEYVSMVGFVEIASKMVFCGGAISEFNHNSLIFNTFLIIIYLFS